MTLPVSLRFTLASAFTATALLTAGCHSAPLTHDRSADEAAVRDTDARWVKVAATRSVEDWVAFYAPDAVLLPPNEKTASDPASIRAAVATLLGLPGLALSWEPTKIVVADSGDLAYLYGRYTLQYKDPSSLVPVTDTGKVAEIWRKQSDGSWKCVLDTWNSDLPAPPTPSSPM